MKVLNTIGIVFLLLFFNTAGAQNFVKRNQQQFTIANKPYYYIGTNYWYGGLLGLVNDEKRGIERLRTELDFLRNKGVTNLRVLAATEGEGQIHGVQRVKNPLQTSKGVFDEKQLKGLDILLSEMGKRNMKAVLFFSNNWEWSGGFLQYLNWNGLMSDADLRKRLNWDEQRDFVSKFYSCKPCVDDYLKQVKLIVTRTNSLTGKKYADDPAIMSWELANEPRPMRPGANNAYRQWISNTAAYIKALDKNHLVTLGHEGEMATDMDMDLFKQVHADKNVDYLTIHIWPKNWGWFKPETLDKDYALVKAKTVDYIRRHAAVAKQLNKPLVIEEFGLPRDHHSFDVASTTTLRDDLYQTIFEEWRRDKYSNGVINGINFWGFGGSARPIPGQTFWKEGDDYTGDPPMEEQGLNAVFDSDASTWNVITAYSLSTSPGSKGIADKHATTETRNLYQNLFRLQQKGIMFGHQDATAYGVHWKYEKGRSDVKDVTGDYPAIYGWELGNLELGMSHNLDSVPFTKMQELMKEAYARGGINTISWHNANPFTLNNAWDTTHGGVQAILPGGIKNALYNDWLDKFAAFVKPLKGSKGEMIPILFRPYHELTGNWFWWCKNTNTPAEYKLLWRYTYDYLTHHKGLHNLLWVYNTADFKREAEFMERYPGDDVVDMVSFDAYQHGGVGNNQYFIDDVNRKLIMLTHIAAKQNKLAALAEAGFEKIPEPNWWTNVLWKAISDHNISYVLLWRNAGRMPNGNMHYYVPFKGDVSADDLKKYHGHPKTLFQKNITKEKVYSPR